MYLKVSCTFKVSIKISTFYIKNGGQNCGPCNESLNKIVELSKIV